MTAINGEAADLAATVSEDAPGIVNAIGVRLADPQLEQQLLGALIFNHEAFGAIAEHVFENDFFDPLHRRIFTLLREAFEGGYAVGMKGMVDALGGDPNAIANDGLTVSQYIAKMLAGSEGGADLEAVAFEIHECADRRANEMADDATEAEPESKFGAIRFRDLDLPGPEYDYLIKGILTRGERSLLVGPSGSGKTFVATCIGFSVAEGEEFLGRRVRKGLVVYQAGEGARGLKKRLRAIRKEKGIERDKNVPFVLLTAPVDLYSDNADTMALIKEAQQWGDLYKREQKVDLELVVIDTLSAATPGANENASEDMSKILARCALIAKHCNCHVMLVHHLNAAGSKPRGHSSLFANIENAIEVSLTDRTCAGKRDDGSEINRPVHVAKLTKQKDGESGLQWDFALKQIVLGKDIDGEAITSCVVVGTTDDGDVTLAGAPDGDKAKAAGGFKLSKQEGLFFECVLDAISESGEAPPAGLSLPHSVTRVVNYDHVKARMARKMLREDDDTEEGRKRHRERVKTALKRARETLMNFKVVGVDNPYIWWTGRPVRGFSQTQPQRRDLLNPNAPQEDTGDLGDFV